MRQTDLFPRATRIVGHLEAYAAELRQEIDHLEDAADKKNAAAKSLGDKLQEIYKAIGDAQSFAAALAPQTPVGDEIVEVIKDEGAFDVDD